LYNDAFRDLPKFAIPSVKLVAIFSGVLCVFSIFSPILKFAKIVWGKIIEPLERRRIRSRLLDVGARELVILTKALSATDRHLRIKSDMAETLNLIDKKIIENYWSGVILGDDLSDFIIPLPVWRIMLSMKEFQLPANENLSQLLENRSLLSNELSEARIIRTLPQMHPATISILDEALR
ncbi:MAG: hypothetical protein AAF891_07390, partial [Pseudomonadota bacterium]